MVVEAHDTCLDDPMVTHGGERAAVSILTARRMVKRFGGVVALNGAEMSLSAGRVRGLLGANGAGKSVLSAILAGEIRPDEGEMSFDGRLVSHASPRVARDRGIVIAHQHASLVSDLPVWENLVSGSRTARPIRHHRSGRKPHGSSGSVGAAFPRLRYRSSCWRTFECGAATRRNRSRPAAKTARSHSRRADRQPGAY